MVAVGDKVWFIHEGFPIAIQCTILEIDEHGDFRLDEPVNHDVDEEDICLTKEAAGELLIEDAEEAVVLWREEGWDKSIGPFSPEGDFTLEEYRREVIKTLARDGMGYGDAEWPDRPREEWMNLNDARALKGTPRSEFEELYGDN